MGDRANIVIRDDWPNDVGEREAVFLYSHWGGSDLPETLRRALAKNLRWEDGGYLARIVFEEMVANAYSPETGFGISTRLTDNEYDLLVLWGQQVCRLSEADYRIGGFTALEEAPSISFADYVAAERTWENLTEVLVGSESS